MAVVDVAVDAFNVLPNRCKTIAWQPLFILGAEMPEHCCHDECNHDPLYPSGVRALLTPTKTSSDYPARVATWAYVRWLRQGTKCRRYGVFYESGRARGGGRGHRSSDPEPSLQRGRAPSSSYGEGPQVSGKVRHRRSPTDYPHIMLDHAGPWPCMKHVLAQRIDHASSRLLAGHLFNLRHRDVG